MKFKNIFLHFKKICVHKHYVRKYCWKVGLYWRGITHDLSKFSPIEFWESVKYYQGNSSPIDACKKDKGYSRAWLHHKGRNKHHYEYWQDNFDNGGTPLQMPFKDSVEMLCDYIAAGKAYMGKNFSYEAEYNWWLNKKKTNLAMHPVNRDFITLALDQLCEYGNIVFFKDNLKIIYDTFDKNYATTIEGEDIYW
jgi:hypothetical protein